MAARSNQSLRRDGRQADQLRKLRIERNFTRTAPGSVLIEAGNTIVLCTASVAEEVPPWLAAQNRGWVTAEYNMLPGSTSPRKPRERSGKLDGRTSEIQRLIGRSLRAIVDLAQIPGRTITVDCDVLQADGGTRTASVTGAFVALVDAVSSLSPAPVVKVFKSSVAAVSVGILEGAAVLDLNYQEDAAAAVDMNVVMTGGGQFVEIQGTGEEATFTKEELAALVGLAESGIKELSQLQRRALGESWPIG